MNLRVLQSGQAEWVILNGVKGMQPSDSESRETLETESLRGSRVNAIGAS